MTERMQATALALDAYEQHLFGDLANGHRTDRAEAEGLLHSLVVDLINYGEGNHLDVVDLLDALVQARIDRGGALTNPRYSFRLNTEVQFRDHAAEHHRGFITELKSSGPRQEEIECRLRIPGLVDPQHTLTSMLEPATRLTPLRTRTRGTAFSALEVEDLIIDLVTALPAQGSETGADPQVLADLAELSAALATWAGTKPDHVLHHLRHQTREIRTLNQPSSAARRAAAAFPNDIAASLAREQPPAPSPSHPTPPRPSTRPRQM
ncbi:hypothetical protein [Actinomadura livida]|uniref:Uncharacterized protein n=1 Tax=Actinomadura livida TaxID=79909 RepID=A0A7W7I7M1_9ACTN|nr:MULTISPECIES: hypothetical protein [Actinomadura]MBB4771930.1 hypothetical protein [Actinomadura catellatispora]GGU03481.1 hypothetical protein GCM10010208_29530 [Actinomadura livida]